MNRWKDDVRDWPKLEFKDIYDYFVNAPACDSQPNQNFRSISEGMNYLNSGWIGTISHCTNEDGIMTLKGDVRFSQTIASFHKVEIHVAKERSGIVSVNCDCIASEGKCCSHSAGLAFKINEAYKKGFIGIACTDEACVWNKSTQENVVPDTVENIQNASAKSMANTALAFDTDQDLMEHLSKPHMVGLCSVPGTILHHLYTAKPPEEEKRTERPLQVHGSHDMKLECKLCKDTYEQNINVSEMTAAELASQTSNQKSSLWTTQRKLRITSSAAATVPKKADTDCTRWIKEHINPRFSGNAATRHGHQSENVARETFEKDFGKSVQTTGLVVRPDCSWMGASLDGIVDDDTILEIKCPTERKLERYGGTVRGLVESGTYDVRHKDGKTFLRQSTAASGYYTQVQIAMYCSKRTKCKFMVWCKKDYVIADVDFDEVWFEHCFQRLEKFYFSKLLPALVDVIASKELKFVRPCHKVILK